MTDRELMQQALDAVDWLRHHLTQHHGCLHMDATASGIPAWLDKTETALRERLAQPEQKPVAWGVFDGPNLHDVNFTEEDAQEMVRLKGDGSVVKPLYTSTQPQMQPCAGRNCGSTNPNLHSAECFEDYEKSTGMSQWVRLTEEEINNSYLFWIVDQQDVIGFGRSIETKLKRKNT